MVELLEPDIMIPLVVVALLNYIINMKYNMVEMYMMLII